MVDPSSSGSSSLSSSSIVMPTAPSQREPSVGSSTPAPAPSTSALSSVTTKSASSVSSVTDDEGSDVESVPDSEMSAYIEFGNSALFSSLFFVSGVS